LTIETVEGKEVRKKGRRNRIENQAIITKCYCKDLGKKLAEKQG